MNFPSAKGMSAGYTEVEDEVEPFEEATDSPSWEDDFNGWRAANGVDDEESNGTAYGMIWIDVETNPSSGCSWSGYSASSNCDYVNAMIKEIKAKG